MDRRFLRSNKGVSSVFYVFVLSGIIVFILIPLLSAVMDKYILQNKLQKIKDSLDITNIAVFNAIVTEQYSIQVLSLDAPEVDSIYKRLLAKNLKLNEDLTPTESSVADGQVIVDEKVLYASVPNTCPYGTNIVRPTIHCKITVPVKPILLRRMVYEVLGKDLFNLNIHVDTEIPIDN